MRFGGANSARILFHRLNVVEVLLPPLRERSADIPELAQYFLDKYACERPTVRGFTPDALARLVLHDWPGNVRELENAVLRAIVIGTSDLIEADDFPLQVGREARPDGVADGPERTAVSCRSIGLVDREPVPASLAANERDAIVAALAASKGHRQRGSRHSRHWGRHAVSQAEAIQDHVGGSLHRSLAYRHDSPPLTLRGKAYQVGRTPTALNSHVFRNPLADRGLRDGSVFGTGFAPR